MSFKIWELKKNSKKVIDEIPLPGDSIIIEGRIYHIMYVKGYYEHNLRYGNIYICKQPLRSFIFYLFTIGLGKDGYIDCIHEKLVIKDEIIIKNLEYRPSVLFPEDNFGL